MLRKISRGVILGFTGETMWEIGPDEKVFWIQTGNTISERVWKDKNWAEASLMDRNPKNIIIESTFKEHLAVRYIYNPELKKAESKYLDEYESEHEEILLSRSRDRFKIRMEDLYRRMKRLNFIYCHSEDTHDTLWPIVNRHLRRLRGMYSEESYRWLNPRPEGSREKDIRYD